MGGLLDVAVRLMGSEDPADKLFKNSKGSSLLTVPQFGPQNPAYGGAKVSECACGVFGQYHYLRAFSGVDTGVPGIISDWCIYGIHAVYGFFSRLRATPVVVGPLAIVPSRDCFLSSIPDGRGSYERGSISMLVYRLKLVFRLNVLSVWVSG